jgi:glycerol-3-phosphate acyltransferase PlsY
VTVAPVLVLAYLLGSIPFGLLAGRLRGIDIRTVGSRNTGATNVFRTLGRGPGVAVMAADILKGLVAVLVARWLTDDPWPVVAGVLAVLGHVFPVWLRFRGGKGVAVAAGALLGLMPLVGAGLVVIWLVLVLVTRYVSLASIVAALALVPLALVVGEPRLYVAVGGVMSVLVIYRHRGNVQRLLRGQELRIELGRARGA